MCMEVLLSLYCSGNGVYMDYYLFLFRHALVSEMACCFPACLEMSFLPIFLLKYQIQVSTLKNTSRTITVVRFWKILIFLQNCVSSFVVLCFGTQVKLFFWAVNVIEFKNGSSGLLPSQSLGTKIVIGFLCCWKKYDIQTWSWSAFFFRINNYPDIISICTCGINFVRTEQDGLQSRRISVLFSQFISAIISPGLKLRIPSGSQGFCVGSSLVSCHI